MQLKAIKNAFFYSLQGIVFLLKERAFKQEIALGVIILCIEFFRCTSSMMRLYLFSSYMLVLISEGINSAIESAVDRIGNEMHYLSKKVKDIGSASVFLALLHLGIIWITTWFL
ncbi:diacylglycerol kinase [Alphaproteobacteria bacterium]|nr:diacylglycerol kinase [Alphaproteobacteria bacterium]